MALDISELDDILSYSLDPLATRRDIAIFGMIHRAVLGPGPNVFQQFFCFVRSPPPPPRPLCCASASSRRHIRHLVVPILLRFRTMFLGGRVPFVSTTYCQTA
eukprot:3108496-Pyramimonas_sp.AAC.1